MHALSTFALAAVAVSLEVQGQPRPEALTASLSDLPGVHDVSTTPSGDQEWARQVPWAAP